MENIDKLREPSVINHVLILVTVVSPRSLTYVLVTLDKQTQLINHVLIS